MFYDLDQENHNRNDGAGQPDAGLERDQFYPFLNAHVHRTTSGVEEGAVRQGVYNGSADDGGGGGGSGHSWSINGRSCLGNSPVARSLYKFQF